MTLEDGDRQSKNQANQRAKVHCATSNLIANWVSPPMQYRLAPAIIPPINLAASHPLALPQSTSFCR